MQNLTFRVWRVLQEEESADSKARVITRKEFIGEVRSPKQEVFMTWPELVERFGEGYYLVEISAAIRRHYVLPEAQLVRTPAYFEPSPFVKKKGPKLIFCYKKY